MSIRLPGTIQRITFKGKPFLLIPVYAEMGAAIATPEQYEAFEESYAHLYPDGRVLRHQVEIGTIADIEIVGPVEENVVRPPVEIEDIR